MDKSWDHPWTTEEIRRKRNEWTLAGDAGLLKHLQQFSENLMSKAVKTQETLNSLSAQLDETAIFIDNITNSSLALANTQFIESRVYEDDVETAKSKEPESQEIKNKEQLSAELMANVEESVRQGLVIMDEKYERLEVVASDSEDEEELAVPSIILRPKNPYQDRPLPYIIGSEKWRASSKIGLESSSSESEQLDEEESESESDEKSREFILNSNNCDKSMMDAISSSSSEPNDYNTENVSIKRDEKMDAKTEDTIDSDSESITAANSVPKHTKHAMPSFAEELAKRLGNMLPSEKSINTHEVDNPEVDQPNNDDIFASKYDDIFSTRSRNLFDNDDKLFNDDDVPVPTQSSKNTPIKSMKANIIPPSSDVPPPMSSISAKPKSAINDPFGDADSEDSDDIFTSKTSTKKVIKKNISTTSKPFHDNIQKTLLTVGTAENTGNMATSTPETIVNANNLFEDEDDNDLFGTPKRENDSSGGTSKTEGSNATKKKPVGGVPVLRPANILASEIRSKFRNRLSSSDSSDSNVTENNDDSSSVQANQDATNRTLPNVNFGESSLPLAAGNLENSIRGTETSESSGISIHPPSFNSTTGSGLGADFQPQMSSSRLRSEEIYRERVISDSLFVPPAHKTGSANSGNITNSLPEEPIEETSDKQDAVFDNEDIFGPPPLPKAGLKTKSKTISLFDDSDSGDDLFSNTSSGSRSQKSADLLVTTPQTFEKSKPFQKNNLFEDEDNIFSAKDSPDVDIFSIGSKTLPQETYPDNKPPADSAITTSKDSRENSLEKASSSKAPWTKSFLKPTSIFDDSDDDEDLFGTNFGKKIQKDNESTTALKLNDTEDLFSVPPKVSIAPEKKELSLNMSNSKIKAKENLLVEKEVIVNTNKSVEIETKESNKVTTMDSLRSGERLFDDVDNDDIDDLFGEKRITKPKQSNSIASEISQSNKAELCSKSVNTKEPEVIINEDSKEMEKINIVHHSILPDTKITTLESTEESESSSSDAVPSIVESEPLSKDPSGISESTISDDPTGGSSRRDPPKTLNIRPAVSPTNEETVAPKRAVSGKIKDLMGRMGDFKILSPTDTPPLWRKNDEVTDELDVPDVEDIADGGCISTAKESPQPVSEEYAQCKPSVQPKLVEREDVEVAVSFDEPAQVGTLAAIASKSRIRIQAKRRPQSRHARQSALRQSGLDFDTVDMTSGNHLNTSHTDLTSNEQNATIISGTERLVVPVEGGENFNRSSESNLTADDKSERSLSKESSMSVNKNTLLSPSTDEEDLFDVPPDLPEDPQKEDLLFGRAPILSPVENVVNSNKKSVQPAKSTSSRPDDFISSKVKSEDISKANQKVTDDTNSYERQQFSADNPYKLNQKLNWTEPSSQENKGKEVNPESKIIADDNNYKKDYKIDEQTVEEHPIDPLNDKSHDPLKDPSQLFAFVTKTPSPEKGQNLLFNEDDSLFTSTSKKTSEIPSTTTKKKTLDLFEDDIGDDLFSAPLTISVKKPLRETKISLFDDDDDDEDDADPDSLFSTFSKSKPLSNSAPVVKEEESSKLIENITPRQEIRFESEDQNLFGTGLTKLESSESSKGTKKIGKTSNLKDIFGDQSSGEDDIFAVKKPVTKTIASSNPIFTHDDDGDDDIFGKPSSASTSQTRIIHHQSIIKKPVTRDLRKTAEKIVEDPLSLLQKD